MLTRRTRLLALLIACTSGRVLAESPRQIANGPVVSAITAEPSTLTPNGRMVAVAITVAVADESDDNPACRITGVIDSAVPFGVANHDVEIAGPLAVNLRAKRGEGDKRSYTVIVACTNDLGQSTWRSTVVRVAPRR